MAHVRVPPRPPVKSLSIFLFLLDSSARGVNDTWEGAPTSACDEYIYHHRPAPIPYHPGRRESIAMALVAQWVGSCLRRRHYP